MNRISTHVLDTALGKPAKDVQVRLEQREASGKWLEMASTRTDQDGRCGQLLSGDAILQAGDYRLIFDTAKYFGAQPQPAAPSVPPSTDGNNQGA